MNTIKINNEKYQCVMCWNYLVDISNKLSDIQPILKEGTFWSGKHFFLEKLDLLEKFLIKKKKILERGEKDFPINIDKNCILCNQKNITNFVYIYNGMVWMEGLRHYFDIHNTKPPAKFIRFVLQNDPTNDSKCKKSVVKIKGKIRRLDKFTYVKIKANQLMILDALLEHGGLKKKYLTKHEEDYRYSEHAGMLQFEDDNKVNLSARETNRVPRAVKVSKVIITGLVSRQKKEDPEIFFPTMGEMAYDYEYIFHTHPATPNIGGRVSEGTLYEFPSDVDIYHFIEHFNNGKLQGSLVIAPEGLYNIRKYLFDKQPIEPRNSIGYKFNKLLREVQSNAIKKYGLKFTPETFYSEISQDTTYINQLNQLLNKYNIQIDYFPRQKTKNNNWIIGTIYLPICTSR